MTPREKVVVRAIIRALHVKRDRLGRLETHNQTDRDMQALSASFPLPHGGYDRIDKATMLLQALAGDPVISVLDDGTQR